MVRSVGSANLAFLQTGAASVMGYSYEINCRALLVGDTCSLIEICAVQMISSSTYLYVDGRDLLYLLFMMVH